MADLFASGTPDPTRGAVIRERHGLDLDLESIQRLVAKHGLLAAP
jgi:hypothetical protein